MKYILIASLLTSAAYAAPLAQKQGGNRNNGATAAGQQTPQQQQGQQQGAQQGTQNGQQNGQNGQGATNTPTGLGAGVQNGQTPSANDLATAVSNWMADTSMVSNFLNTGPTIQNNVQFKQAATVAFNAEVDELNHKAVIDAANGNDPNVIAANSTLATGGSFQDVVDKLQQMSVQGLAAADNIDLINQNRCVNVLPNIDAYMASTGSSSQAVRPTVCDQTGVAGGVQGTGATQPGQPAGSPAAAFAAAQALAAGTGNGLVQNGAQQGSANQGTGNQNTGNQGTGTQGTGTQGTGTQGTGTQGAANQGTAAATTPTNGQQQPAAGQGQGTTGTTGQQQGQKQGGNANTGAAAAGQAQQQGQTGSAATGNAAAGNAASNGRGQGQAAGTSATKGQAAAAGAASKNQ